MLLPPVGQDNLISYRSSELLTNPEDIASELCIMATCSNNRPEVNLRATYQFMLVLKMTGTVCEVRTKMSDARIHACRSVVSTPRCYTCSCL